MPPVEFEEKEHEGPLNAQLAFDGLMWPPGQVLENVVGFDVALNVQASCFWTIFGYPAPLQGAVVMPAWWPKAPSSAFSNRHPPSYKLNAFLQYKRPEYLYGATAKERHRWPTGVYYRFFLDAVQQAALEACASSLGSNGLVLYATPAFYERTVLFDHIEKRMLVAHTHFVKAMHLKGHGRYTYADARSAGQGYSRPVDIMPYIFESSGDHGDGVGGGPPRRPPPDGGGNNGRSPAQLLKEARVAVEEAVAASPDRVGGQQHFRRRILFAETILGGAAEEQPIIHDFITAWIFSALANIPWFIQ